MGKKDLFGDDLDGKPENDFGAMLEQSLRPARFQVGESLRGELLSIGKEESFVALGSGVDGMIPTLELLDDKKNLKYKKGDFLDVTIIKMREGEIRLRRKDSKTSADIDSLEDAFDMEIPVEGKVLEAVKGGFRIQFAGKTAFCPVSQIDLRPSADLNSYVGGKFEFLITQFEAAGRNIVVSRKKLLEMQKAEHEGAFLQSHSVGDIVEGQVTRLEAYGAFVEIEKGVEGLVHISEISWARLGHPSEVLTLGTPVRVKILSLDEVGERLKLSLSIKQGGGETDPWLRLTEEFPVGRQVEGTVTKKEVFGLFVQIAPGLQGLLPRSKWRDSTEAATYENKKKGDTVPVRVDQIDLAARRLTLGLPGEEQDESWRSHQSSSKGLGTMADLFKTLKK